MSNPEKGKKLSWFVLWLDLDLAVQVSWFSPQVTSCYFDLLLRFFMGTLGRFYTLLHWCLAITTPISCRLVAVTYRHKILIHCFFSKKCKSLFLCPGIAGRQKHRRNHFCYVVFDACIHIVPSDACLSSLGILSNEIGFYCFKPL